MVSCYNVQVVANGDFIIKNNIVKAYSQVDPLIRVATSYQNVYKIIIDRQFKDLKSRMLYSFDCLLFDLQKQGLSQQIAYQIVSKIQNSFIITHLSSASIIKKMRDKQQQKSFLWQNNKENIIKEIEKQIKQIKDQQVLIFKNNICQLIQKNKDLENNIFLKFFLQFMNKYKTQVFDIKYLNKNNQEVSKKISVGYIEQKDMIYKQIIKQKETNLPDFFYYGYVDIQNKKDHKYQENKVIYCTIDLSKLYLLKKFFNNKIYLEVVKKCIKFLRPQQIHKWISLMGGPYFQNKILSIFQNNQKRNLIFLTKNKLIQPIYIDIEVQGTKKLPAIDILMIYDKQFIIQYANKILNQTNIFYSTGQDNFCYDFVVSNLTVTKKLQIFLIDTTIQQKIQSKVNKFQNQLLKLDVFLEILNQCAKSEYVKQIQLYFCVLNGRKISEVKIFIKYNPSINKTQLKEKLTRVIGFEACFDKQSFLIKDQFGIDKTQSLKDLFQEIVQLKFKDKQIKQ